MMVGKSDASVTCFATPMEDLNISSGMLSPFIRRCIHVWPNLEV